MTILISRRVPTGPELYSMYLDHLANKNTYISLDKDIQTELQISIPDGTFQLPDDLSIEHCCGEKVMHNDEYSRSRVALYRLGGVVLMTHIINLNGTLTNEDIKTMVMNLNRMDECHFLLDQDMEDEAAADTCLQDGHLGCILSDMEIPDYNSDCPRSALLNGLNDDFGADGNCLVRNSFWSVRIYIKAMDVHLLILYTKVLLAVYLEVCGISLDRLKSMAKDNRFTEIQDVCNEILNACGDSKIEKSDPENGETFWEKTTNILSRFALNPVREILNHQMGCINLAFNKSYCLDDLENIPFKDIDCRDSLDCSNGMQHLLACILFDLEEQFINPICEYIYSLQNEGNIQLYYESLYWHIHQTTIKLYDKAKLDKENKVQYAKPILKFIETGLLEKEDISLKDISDHYDVLMDIIGAKNLTGNPQKIAKEAPCTRDFGPVLCQMRDNVINSIKNTFKNYGAVQIDTPVLNLHQTFMGKYGEDSKLIYQLRDQEGEQLSLRYDLTVPFAKYCASNGIDAIRRFHIGKVYRRDEPQMTKGRFREFYQCDFDICGSGYGLMVPEQECISCIVELVTKFEGVLGDFRLYLNHRRLLDRMMAYCGVPDTKFRTVCSSIDKLDKCTWEEVENELITEKEVSKEIVDKVKFYTEISYDMNNVSSLMDLELCKEDAEAKSACEELVLLAEYLEASNCVNKVIFDFKLARGLDYYTGVIYEAKMLEGGGSIAAGGRYDKLIGMFSGKDLPAVGVSLGIERIFRFVENKLGLVESGRGTTAKIQGDLVARAGAATEVYVITEGISLNQRISICTAIRNENIPCEFLCQEAKYNKQFKVATGKRVSYIVFQNEKLFSENNVELRPISYGGEKQDDNQIISISEIGKKIFDIFEERGSSIEKDVAAMGLDI